MRSPFRPDIVPDAAILQDHKPLIRSLERRGLISGSLSLGALVMLTGCDVKRPEAVDQPFWQSLDSTMAYRRCCSIRTNWRRLIPPR